MKVLYPFVLTFFLGACSTLQITTTPPLPKAEKVQSISLFSLQNYTDTPQAGMRASNLVEGVLLSKRYKVVNLVSARTESLDEMIQIARNRGSDYLLTGGVSEWLSLIHI